MIILELALQVKKEEFPESRNKLSSSESWNW